jgi:flagellar biosynthesis anti-sigma factor FlgM
MDIKKVANYTMQDVQYTDATRRSTGEEKATSRETGSPDTVQLSGRYQEMAKVQKVMMESEDVRTEQVAQYKRQIEDGTYQVNSDAVAQKMIEEMV